MKIVLTGGSGFIGRYLIDQIREMYPSANIYNIDIVSNDKHQPVKFIDWDIRKDSEIARVVAEIKEADILIHLAALCKEPGYLWNEYFETNAKGTTNVIALADLIGVDKIIFMSTMMVFKSVDQPRGLGDITDADTAYGISKIIAEREIIDWAIKNDKSVHIIRPGVVFGKGEFGNFTNLVKAVKRNAFFYVGKKSTVKGSIYVKSLVQFTLIKMASVGQLKISHAVFPQRYTIEETVDVIASILELKRRFPVINFKVAKLIGVLGEIINLIGVNNPINRRRIEKLYYSTDLIPTGDFVDFISDNHQYPTLTSSIKDWMNDF